MITLNHLVESGSKIILGKPEALRLALVCFMAEGHLLIEDVPGMGKTTLARLISKLLGMSFQRIQFTSDLLPADILGAPIFDRRNNEFIFQAGPIFNELILADELNRATPKTQSALLEAMEEGQVTIDGVTRALGSPFFVIATQNPSHQVGTFVLPESQLDRFLMRIQLSFPDEASERLLLKGESRRVLLENFKSEVNRDDLLVMREEAKSVQVSEPILDYVQAIIQVTRSDPGLNAGLSPRASIGLINASKAYAYSEERMYVLPEDVQAVLPAVVGHRVFWKERLSNVINQSVGEYLVEKVSV